MLTLGKQSIRIEVALSCQSAFQTRTLDGIPVGAIRLLAAAGVTRDGAEAREKRATDQAPKVAPVAPLHLFCSTTDARLLCTTHDLL